MCGSFHSKTNHWKLILFCFIFIIIISISFAFDCSRLDSKYRTDCASIINSNEINSASIIINLPYENDKIPMYDYVKSWNEKISFTTPPNNVKTYQSKYIKNAWLQIVSINPSIIYNNDLIVSKNSKVISGYNHDTILPDDYYSSKYPDTDNGDCKRINRLTNDNTILEIFVNDNLQSENIIISKNSKVKAKETINVNVDIDHYKWKKSCSKRNSNGVCVLYSYKCTFSITEKTTDTQIIENVVNVKYENTEPKATIETINKVSDTIKTKINISDSATFDFGNGKYDFQKYSYEFVYDYEPYYVLTIKATEKHQESFENTRLTNDYLYIEKPNDCKISYRDFFTTREKECDLSFEEINLNIQTDKLIYREGETVKVSVTPNDKQVSVSYANQTINAKDTALFEANVKNNKITA
ncbi:MAG: hypothetical protein WC755_07100, partial [Candidatus Woesearchaeota archaeon]